jgi:molybdopterin converting factor small subunit
LIRGRIGAGWYDVDRQVKLPVGTTLRDLVNRAPRLGLPLAEALAQSPHLKDTLMLNGVRCPIESEGERLLTDGDQLYLLAPLAGG